ncbi:hypothetical protein ES703_76052 [subsurface metagenome]
MAIIDRLTKFRKRKVGLALGGGAARGLAHIGVLEVLQREDIPINLIAGTSIGAVIGAVFARGKDTQEIKKLVLEMVEKRFTFIDPSLPRTGFIKGRKIKKALASFIGGEIRFSDLKIPFACVATDIDTGEEVVIDEGSVPEAVRASISIPAIFTLVKWKGRYLVDGGLTNPVPISVLQKMGADFIIAVNAIPDVTERARRVKKEKSADSKEPNIINILMQSTYIGTYALVKSSMESADIVIEPRVVHIGAADFHHAGECIRQGELAAQEAIPEIKRRLRI